MASRADDVVAKVSEALGNPLYVAIGAVCSTPNQTTKKCRELGITTEGEKLAKWIAILKRDSQNLFKTDFLKKLKEIYDIDRENKMTKSKKKVEVIEEYSKKTSDKVCKDLWKKHHVDVWFKRLNKRTKGFFFKGEKVSTKKINSNSDYHFRINKSNHITHLFTIYLKTNSKDDLFSVTFLINSNLYKRGKGSYEETYTPEIRITVKHRKSTRHARILAKWLQEHPEWCDKVVIVKDYA